MHGESTRHAPRMTREQPDFIADILWDYAGDDALADPSSRHATSAASVAEYDALAATSPPTSTARRSCAARAGAGLYLRWCGRRRPASPFAPGSTARPFVASRTS